MTRSTKVRMNWLKGMYIYTIIGAGGFGLGMLVAPELIKSIFAWPVAEPIAFGIVASVWVAFAILSIFGLRSPLRFAPVLFLQLCYKTVWFIGIALPLLATAQFPRYAILHAVIFATYIIGDVIAIPFSHLFAKSSE